MWLRAKVCKKLHTVTAIVGSTRGDTSSSMTTPSMHSITSDNEKTSMANAIRDRMRLTQMRGDESRRKNDVSGGSGSFSLG